MCGIAGAMALFGEKALRRPNIEKMILMLSHRGPESIGVHEDPWISLAHARLSIIDVEGGVQPIANEDKTIWCICNGEVFNYVELQRSLKEKQHIFRTNSDTEVLLHLYEEAGASFVDQLIGQFAFALWDSRQKTLILGRDRLGIRPLFYSINDGYLLFGSEMKAILSVTHKANVNQRALAQIFTTWSPLPGETIFEDIKELYPGHLLFSTYDKPQIKLLKYWQLQFPDAVGPRYAVNEEEQIEHVRWLLDESVKLQMRADVEVGTYFSGGLDSALITALAKKHSSHLHSFSIAFQDPHFDERKYQENAAQALGTTHHIFECNADAIRSNLPDVVWHTEVPILRLSPVPMYLLSSLVHNSGLKVVLTGEGADEFFCGYDIFKETLVRNFMARAPESKIRPLLLAKIYPYMGELHQLPPATLRLFFGRNLDDYSSPCFSHSIRWQNSLRLYSYFSSTIKDNIRDYSVLEDIKRMIPEEIRNWAPLSKAQYLEVVTFLSTYLLSSQGDRVGMAHAVECRYPFLDHRLIEIANKLPSNLKIRNLHSEKYVLKCIAKGLIPADILYRPKYPYRAPIASTFLNHPLPDYAEELLSPSSVREGECFDPKAVTSLTDKLQVSHFMSEIDQMDFVGILTYQLFYEQFIKNWRGSTAKDDKKIDYLN